jgi:hypothetical protein
MSYDECDNDDAAVALRLVLCFLDNNPDAYRAVMAEQGASHCLGCSHRVINALVGFAAGMVVNAESLTTRLGFDTSQCRESAIQSVEHSLAQLLDELDL